MKEKKTQERSGKKLDNRLLSKKKKYGDMVEEVLRLLRNKEEDRYTALFSFLFPTTPDAIVLDFRKTLLLPGPSPQRGFGIPQTASAHI
jgi:hypothetical protein